MSKRYSMAEARKQLSSILDDAEAGAIIEITRRGKPTAVVVSPTKLKDAREGTTSFAKALAAYRKKLGDDWQGLEPGYFDSLRPKDVGRKVKL